MRFSPLLLLLLSTLFLAFAWKENEPGLHEVTHFDWLVRENERAGAVSIATSGKEIASLDVDELDDAPDLDEDFAQKCSVYGLKYWEDVLESKKEICPSITQYENGQYFNMFVMHNVSVTSETKTVMAKGTGWTPSPGGTPEFKDSQLSFQVAGESCRFPLMTPHAASGFLGSVRGISHQKLNEQCETWIEDPLYILASFDPANWFHFVERAVVPAFTYYGVAQPYFKTRNPQIATLRWPAKQEYNTRNREIYPTWNALPEILERMVNGKLRVVPNHPFTTERKPRECYRTVAWGLGEKLFLNIQNLNQMLEKNTHKGCFSSIVRSAADVVRSVMGVPYIRGPGPTITQLNTSSGEMVTTRTTLPIRIVYMKRSQGETWTRHQGSRQLTNQDEVIEFLRTKSEENGLSFEELEFYYTDMKNAEEQIRAIGRATVMVGIHGAGLAGMIALPPGSTVVELRLRNMNLRDNHFVFMAYTMGHKYLQVKYPNAKIPQEQMNEIWDTIVKQTQIGYAARQSSKERQKERQKDKESALQKEMQRTEIEQESMAWLKKRREDRRKGRAQRQIHRDKEREERM